MMLQMCREYAFSLFYFGNSENILSEDPVYSALSIEAFGAL